MADSEEVERRRKAIADAKANRSVLDSPLQKAGQWVFDLLYSDEPNPADMAMPMTAPGKQALTPIAQASRDALVRLLKPIAAPAIRAYHGSPFKFDQFKLNPGAGAGDAVFGEGLYFTDVPESAKYWAERTAGDRLHEGLMKNAPRQPYVTIADAIEATAHRDPSSPATAQQLSDYLREQWQHLDAQKSLSPSDEWWLETVSEAREELARNPGIVDEVRKGVDLSKPTGHQYEVNLHLSPEELLYSDKPYVEQPELVQAALGKAGLTEDAVQKMSVVDDYSNTGRYGAEELLGSDLYDAYGYRMSGLREPGTMPLFGRRPSSVRAAASHGLNASGVKGMQHHERLSRTTDSLRTPSNYVLFDPDRVEILRRYGLAGAVGGAGLTDLLYGDSTGQKPTVTKIR